MLQGQLICFLILDFEHRGLIIVFRLFYNWAFTEEIHIPSC